MKKIYYETTNNIKLCGIITESEIKDKIVIMCHGIRGNKDECGAFTLLSKRLLENGYSSFRFDFNGHGESEGKDLDMTITKEINDLESTVKMLEQKGYKEFTLRMWVSEDLVVNNEAYTKRSFKAKITVYAKEI